MKNLNRAASYGKQKEHEGELAIKMHTEVDTLENLIDFKLTSGQCNDIKKEDRFYQAPFYFNLFLS